MTEKVYLDLTLDGEAAGRVVIGLYGDEVPKTAMNFSALGMLIPSSQSSRLLIGIISALSIDRSSMDCKFELQSSSKQSRDLDKQRL